MPSGTGDHFNITQITETYFGRRYYTLYDAGADAQVMADKGVLYAKAVRKKLLRGSISDLMQKIIERKISCLFGSAEDQQVLSHIEGALGEATFYSKWEPAQQRGNCTTRSQRILMFHILKNDELSNRMYNFFTDTDINIRAALNEKLHRLEAYRDALVGLAQPVPPPLPPEARLELPTDSGAGASRAENTRRIIWAWGKAAVESGCRLAIEASAAVKETVTQPRRFVPMGMGFGFGFGIKTSFAIVAAHITLPAFVAPVLVAASAGATTRIIMTGIKRYRSEQNLLEWNWIGDAAWKGAAFGAIGGVIGQGVHALFTHFHLFGMGDNPDPSKLGHEVASKGSQGGGRVVPTDTTHPPSTGPTKPGAMAPNAEAPAAVPRPLSPPSSQPHETLSHRPSLHHHVVPGVEDEEALRDAKDSLDDILQSGLLDTDRTLRALAEKAVFHKTPVDIEHALKEISFKLNWGPGHSQSTRAIALKLMENGARIAKTHGLAGGDANADMLVRDYANAVGPLRHLFQPAP